MCEESMHRSISPCTCLGGVSAEHGFDTLCEVALERRHQGCHTAIENWDGALSLRSQRNHCGSENHFLKFAVQMANSGGVLESWLQGWAPTRRQHVNTEYLDHRGKRRKLQARRVGLFSSLGFSKKKKKGTHKRCSSCQK